MSEKRSRMYWLLNITGSLCLGAGPLCSYLLCLLFTGNHGEQIATKDLPRIVLFVSENGAVWVLALAAIALGLITAIRFRSRWGTAIFCIALALAVNLCVYAIPSLHGG